MFLGMLSNEEQVLKFVYHGDAHTSFSLILQTVGASVVCLPMLQTITFGLQSAIAPSYAQIAVCRLYK